MHQAANLKYKLCQTIPLPVQKLTEKIIPLLRVHHIKIDMLLANFNESNPKFL